MNNLVDDILETLQTHALVKTTRVVHYDETPSRNIKKDLKEISDCMAEKEKQE